MSKGDIAKQIFEQGYNCAQSVLMAYSEDFGISKRDAARIACGLGGGIARMRETCGAALGAIMIIGLRYSDGSADDKTDIYERSRAFLEEFQKKCGSCVCRELLGLAEGENCSPKPDKRTDKYYADRPCSNLVGMAAEMLKDYL